VVIPEELVAVIADDADANGDGEIQCRERILSGEKLQSVWPLGSTGPV
jgi:regulator of RNase E activity RraA